MTRGEIQIVVFLVLALLTGALVQWLRARDTREHAPATAATPAPARWAKPPYVFKSPKETREAGERAAKQP
jgi:hypothetical protein